MLARATRVQQCLGCPAVAARCLAGAANDKTQEGLGERLKHAAEDMVHRAEDALHRVEHRVEGAMHKVTDAVHERREHAHEEAERGMFTGDDIREAADQAAHSRDHWGGGKRTQPRRQYQPDDEEQLLEEASSDLGRDWRQKELEGLRGAVKEDDAQATEAIKHRAEAYRKDHS